MAKVPVAVKHHTDHEGRAQNKCRITKCKLAPEKRIVKVKVIDYMTYSFRKSVREAIAISFLRGNPVARYDPIKEKPYMEYPDGTRDYREQRY